uniref:Outer membrane protein assembly factor BamC n=1 Tax=uncultured Thiotrichaceae bacterium TaxID=298394 RepID=A0A6S6SHS2_9GAMM|nr:MAG: Unknown protein [uncultured Thiotrichaceae bacterium]
MPDIKQVVSSVIILSAAVVVSSCSMLPDIPMLDGSPVSDNMKYRSNDASIKALSIPPELSKPAFDDSYAINKPTERVPSSIAQQSNNSGRVMSRQEMLNSQSTPVQSGGSVAATPARQQPAQVRTQVVMTKVKSGEPALAVNASPGTTWSRLGGMLTAVGLEVTKRQPSQGIFTVVYKGDPTVKRGFLSRMLDSVEGVSLKSDIEQDAKSPLTIGETYLVLLVGNAKQQSFIGVRNAAGKTVTPAISTYILGLLKGQYER